MCNSERADDCVGAAVEVTTERPKKEVPPLTEVVIIPKLEEMDRQGEKGKSKKCEWLFRGRRCHLHVAFSHREPGPTPTHAFLAKNERI